MTYLQSWSWRAYVRAAVLLVASPEPPPAVRQPRLRYRMTKALWQEAEPLMAKFVEAGKRADDPMIAALFSQVPRVFAFAISLCGGNLELAQEIVQEGLTRAYKNLPTFQAGSDLKANLRSWLITIVNNFYRSDYRKWRHEAEDPDGIYTESLECPPDQMDNLELKELLKAVDDLPAEQREALLLVTAGYSQDEVAAIVGCAVGTVKSRVNRARTRVAEQTGAEAGDLTPAGRYLGNRSTGDDE
jgi:RNA polymerase sigma-70 factor (ECF subfamily)